MKSLQRASVARSPRTARQGSPGTSLASANTMKMIPSRTGMVTRTRRTTNWVIDAAHPDRIDASIDSGGAADAPPPIVLFALRSELLFGLRVEVAAPEAGPVIEQACPALVERVLRVPLEGVAGDDVVGVELRAVMELHVFAELAGPGLGVGARRALLGQGRHRVGAVISIESFVGLLAGTEALAVRLVRAEEAERLGVALEDDGLPVGRLHPCELLAAEDGGVGAGDIRLEGGAGGTVGDDHCRDVLLDKGVCSGIGSGPAVGVRRRQALVEGVDDVLERRSELLARARAEVVVEEVRRIGIVSAPADQAQALEGFLGEAVDHRA